jgi:hypothetical protein
MTVAFRFCVSGKCFFGEAVKCHHRDGGDPQPLRNAASIRAMRSVRRINALRLDRTEDAWLIVEVEPPSMPAQRRHAHRG